MDSKKLDIYRLIAYFVVAALLFPGPQLVMLGAVLTGHILGALVIMVLWAVLLGFLIIVSSRKAPANGVDSPIVTSEHLLVVKSTPGQPQEIREARTRKLH